MKTVVVLEHSEDVRSHLEAILRNEGLLATGLANANELQSYLTKRDGVDLFLLYHRELLLEPTLWNFIRDRWPGCPIFVLLEDDSPSERAKLLRQGADECLSPPLNEAELTARIHNLLRRSAASQADSGTGNTMVKQQYRMIVVDGQSHRIPAKEFHLLKCLSQNPGRVVDRTELLDHVWGANAEIDTNVLEVTVSNLRKRLNKLGSNLKIKNSRNLGYWIEF